MSRKVTWTVAFTFTTWLAHASEGDIAWTRDRILDDVIKINGYPYTEEAAESLVHCGSLCVSVSSCSSFFFLATTGRCLLNEFVFVKPGRGQAAPGARYFKPESSACPVSDGYVLLRGQRTCFKIDLTPLTFVNAYETCTSVGSRLAVLDTRAKVTAVMEYLRDGDITTSRVFIGGARDGVLNGSRTTWNSLLHPLYWLNGEKVSTNGPDTIWLDENPSNSNGNEGCMEITLEKWNDIPCMFSSPFICEKVLN